MKKMLFVAAAAMAVMPAAAQAQDKYRPGYTPQQPAPVAGAPVRPAVTYDNRVRDDRAYDSALTGAYVGLYGGHAWVDADTNVAGVNGDLKGWDYGAFVGYRLDRHLQNSIGINGAIEAFYGRSNADDTVGGVDLDKKKEWGINFRPGISISETINPYGIIGYRRATFKATGPGFSGSETFDGFDLGIGTELVTHGNWGVRLDYTHTWYSEENGIDPDEDNVRVGVSYRF